MPEFKELKRLAEQVSKETHWHAQIVATEEFREASGPDVVLELIAENERLCAEVCGLRKDAVRYQVIRELHWYDSPLAVVRSPKAQVKPGTDCPSEERLDEAVDALILEKSDG
ncbi:hypothetical protein [Pseudomonas sp. PDM19]|uniref:hypothetical protein n=1 Tax=Pseudomonas sp. PDM19 TaxID=2769272 RepID=UPI0017826AFE|nr:hypothetical protein [Pseudomonas sp. PDM19]MBD9629767.1 hypothetical protein [Pseudomonas sp. PDM19]